MLSKMAQPNNVGGGGGSTSTAGGRRIQMSLSGSVSGSGASASRSQQSAASNGSSKAQQPSNTIKKNELNTSGAAFVSIKKLSSNQQRSHSNSSASSFTATSVSKEDERKTQNSKTSNGNQKSSQNGSSNAPAKEQQKLKEKQFEKRETDTSQVSEEIKTNNIDIKASVETAIQAIEAKKSEVASTEIIDLVDDCEITTAVPRTPTTERKSSRRAGATSQEKLPIKPEQRDPPPEKKQEEEPQENAEVAADVEMETLKVDASPVRIVPTVQPAATSTPGRNLFEYLGNNKQTTAAELATQLSSSPSIKPARSYAQISGRRSIRPAESLTPGKLGNYRCVTNDLDTSNCTNTSMNATVGSDIPNSSSFSFSFFGRGRKRERTPPLLAGSQSDNGLAQDLEMSPPKRARFDLFSLNLASPFTMLRTRFSKATISTPTSRQIREATPAASDEDGGKVQNVSGIITQEEERELNKSSTNNEVSVGQEACQDTPKKSCTLLKDTNKDEKDEEQGEDAVANLPSENAESGAESNGPNRSRCAIM